MIDQMKKTIRIILKKYDIEFSLQENLRRNHYENVRDAYNAEAARQSVRDKVTLWVELLRMTSRSN